METASLYQVCAGIVPGRGHILDARNCQDALWSLAFTLNERAYIVGVIADGCGEGRYSEVGARMAVQFIPREIRHLAEQEVPVEQVPALLFERLVQFLKRIAGAYHFSACPSPLVGVGSWSPEMQVSSARTPRTAANIEDYVQFVSDHLLFTVVGFMVAPEQTYVFAAGDGVVIINDEVHCRAQNNTPEYVGYHLIDRNYLRDTASQLPSAFDLYTLPTVALKRLAIGSDAWLEERPLLEQVWGNTTHAQLQLRMNRWSNARHFKDDASLIVLERVPSMEGAD